MTNNADDFVLITDGENSIRLEKPESYPDGHGFHQRVYVVAGPLQGSIKVSSFEPLEALRSFHAQLITLYHDLKGPAELPNSYEYLTLELRGDGRGHITVKVDVATGDSIDIRLSYSIRIDQTQLPAIITAVERVFLE